MNGGFNRGSPSGKMKSRHADICIYIYRNRYANLENEYVIVKDAIEMYVHTV